MPKSDPCARSERLALRIAGEDLRQVREAADASGETVAEFVRTAAMQRVAGTGAAGSSEESPGAVPVQLDSGSGAASPGAADRLTRSERRVLAAVTARANLGSVASVAAAAGLSWSAARGALDGLAARSVITRRARTQVRRHGCRGPRVWVPSVSSPDFERLWSQARRVALPSPQLPEQHAGPLPEQFWSLFWNHPDPSALRLPADADYVANRLLNGPSHYAALWASVHLPADALRACLSLRSTDAATRDLIRNALAHHERAVP